MSKPQSCVFTCNNSIAAAHESPGDNPSMQGGCRGRAGRLLTAILSVRCRLYGVPISRWAMMSLREATHADVTACTQHPVRRMGCVSTWSGFAVIQRSANNNTHTHLGWQGPLDQLLLVGSPCQVHDRRGWPLLAGGCVRGWCCCCCWHPAWCGVSRIVV